MDDIELEQIFDNVKSRQPYIHNFANIVTANDCANIVLALYGHPTMANNALEVEEITASCDALVINMGTADDKLLEAMVLAGKRANALKHVTVLDPVGAGSSRLRGKIAQKLLDEIQFDVIRGNSSEIRYLDHRGGGTRGVDASEEDSITEENMEKTIEMAQHLSKKTGAVVIVSGKIDVVGNQDKVYIVHNGHEMMSRVTGTGCMLSSAVGTICAANKSCLLDSCAAAVAAFGLSGEIAYEKMKRYEGGTASYRMFLIDAMSNMNGITLAGGIKIESR